MSAAPKSLVIVGGGFAGVYAARALRRRLPRDWELTLFSRENHFIFTPLLGDVVGSSINPMHVVWPIRQMAPGISCLTATLTDVDLARQEVIYQAPDGKAARHRYDQLVLACGAEVNLDIIPGMAAHALPLKTMGDALVLRNRLIDLLEKAEVEPEPHIKQRLLSVVIVGAGFSGVEVAGETADLLRGSCKYYGHSKPSDIKVSLLEAQPRILPPLPDSLSAFAQRKMEQNGIHVRVGTAVQSVTEEGVHLTDGSTIEASTVICTIGTTVSPLIASLGLPLQRNRIQVQPDMQVPGCAQVWAIGDCAAVPDAQTGVVSPPTAQFAIRQGKQLARNIVRHIQGQPTQPFVYTPKGMLASIGAHKAVGTVFGWKVSGFPAWFLWRGFYLSQMPTLARKIQIAFDWAWQLFFRRDLVQLRLQQTERLSRAHYEKGQFVFHKGQPGDVFYIIERGTAGVYLDESQPPVAMLHAGEHFGEGALLRTAPRSASIHAETALDVLMLSRDSFRQIASNLEMFRKALEQSIHAARSSVRLLEMARDNPRLNQRMAREVMSQPVVTLPQELTFEAALHQAQEGGRGAYPVVDEQQHMIGLCTRTDFYQAVQQMRPPQTPLTEIMHKPVITVRASDSLTEALLKFLRQPIKRLVVVADDDPLRPVGMLTPFDILRTLPVEDWQPQADGVAQSV